MKIGFFEILLLLGIVQGLMLSVVLFTHKSNCAANRLLGMMMFFLSCEIFYLFGNRIGITGYFIYLVPIFFSLPFIYVPFLFLYVKELTSKEGIKKADAVHFMPLICSLAAVVIFYFTSGVELKSYLFSVNAGNIFFIELINNFKPVYAVVYIVFLLYYMTEYKKELKSSFSNLDKINLDWLRNLLGGIIFIVVIVVVQNILEFINDEKSILESVLFISLVILIYLIGYLGLKQPEIFTQLAVENEPPKDKGEERYRKSGLSESAAQEYMNRLLDFMEKEKPYLKGDLTLQELADKCGISSHHLSEVINTKLYQSYYDFVNKYRVDEFIARLEEDRERKYTILSLAYDCGFNSKSSFNSIFKKFTGKTPSEYRQQNAG